MLKDLLTRLFLNFRTSLDGYAYAVIAFLMASGVDLNTANREKILAIASLLALSVWKLFSKDPVPQPEAGAGK